MRCTIKCLNFIWELDCGFVYFLVFHLQKKLFFSYQVTDELLNDIYNDSMTYTQFLRHNSTISIIYCVAYILVFCVGLVGNLFVISVVFRVPRMRTVTNLFIANLAIADVLVIVFCVPATLMSNLFVRKYQTLHYFYHLHPRRILIELQRKQRKFTHFMS